MEYPKKELIKEITDLFEDYEEAYVPGEWESFSKKNREKYLFFPIWIKVAALLILVGSVSLFTMKDLLHRKNSVNQVAVKQTGDKDSKVPAGNGHTAAGSRIAVQTEKYASGRTASASRYPASLQDQHRIGPGLNEDRSLKRQDTGPSPVIVYTNPPLNGDTADKRERKESKPQLFAGNNVQQVPVKTPVQRDTVARAKKERLNTLDFLAAESKGADKAVKKRENGSKWNFGVGVIPAVSGSNLNFGAGLTTAYRISDKFSLSSGISVMQMESARDIPASGNNMVSLRMIPDKQLLAVDATIKAIDIPLGLIYKVNNHFYTSAGVSFFNVISDQRSNTFAQTSQVSKMTMNPETGFVSSYSAVENKEVAEPTPESPLKGNSYLGFFNFSIGRQQHIFNRYIIQVEPFVKVPLGKLSNEDLKLTNSGIKLQVLF
jgi:hypothetical protein